MTEISIGDLVSVRADNCDSGLGLVLESDNDGVSHAFKVLTQDGRRLFYFTYELELVSREQSILATAAD